MSPGNLPKEYEFLEVLGQGSNGVVYLIRDIRDDRKYAAKEFSVSKEAAQKFFRELSILFSLDHPNIIRCVNFIYSASSASFLILEFASGGSLRNLLSGNPSGIGTKESYRVGKHIASAIAAAHQNRIIHCDLKPDNILIAFDSDHHPVYKLSDLGIAFQILRDEAPKSRGTPFYMAPEQFFDHPLPSSDFYSLGVVLYECLTGTTPFTGGAEQLFVAHQQNQPDLSLLPSDAWRSLIGRLLAKSPSDRPESAEEILDMLETVGENRRTFSLSPPPKSKPRPPLLGQITESPAPPIPVPGASTIFGLGDDEFLYVADRNSIDRINAQTGMIQRQVWVGKYSCSAVAAISGDCLMILSGRLWISRGGATAFRIATSENFQAESACAHPEGDFFVLADQMRIAAVTTSGTTLWSAENKNYFLKPCVFCLPDGRVLAGSGPANPSVNIFSSTGDFIHRFSLPGPLLALAPGTRGGVDAVGVVQGLSAYDPAKIIEISIGGVREVANLIPGVFHARWNDSFLSLFSSSRQLIILDRDGTNQKVFPLPADPLADANGESAYAVLLKPVGPAIVQLFRVTNNPSLLTEVSTTHAK